MIAASTHDDVLPPQTEARLGQFTELMATAIANAEARAEVARLALGPLPSRARRSVTARSRFTATW
mgnify:CR=1 FL=1